MSPFDKLLHIRRSIVQTDEKIFELVESVSYPKTASFSDTPKGGGDRRNAIEEYVIKKERLENKRAALERKLNFYWNEIEVLFEKRGITKAQTAIIRYRFYDGMPWKHIVPMMQKNYANTTWNEQKLFRLYRKVLAKIKDQNITKR